MLFANKVPNWNFKSLDMLTFDWTESNWIALHCKNTSRNINNLAESFPARLIYSSGPTQSKGEPAPIEVPHCKGFDRFSDQKKRGGLWMFAPRMEPRTRWRTRRLQRKWDDGRPSVLRVGFSSRDWWAEAELGPLLAALPDLNGFWWSDGRRHVGG